MKKNIRNLINEVLGVPDNILTVSEEIYDDILREVDNLERKANEYKMGIFSQKGFYTIDDYNIVEIDLTINLYPHNDFNIVGASVKGMMNKSIRGGRAVMSNIKGSEVELNIDFTVPKDWELDEFKSFFKQEKNEILSSLSHELMHKYENQKNEFADLKERGKYVASKELMGFMPPLSDFSFFIYFISKIEAVVRPTEVSMNLRRHNVKPEEFLKFMLTNKTHETLVKIRNFSFDDLKNEIKEFVKDPNNGKKLDYFFYNSLDIKNFPDLSDDEKVEEVLHAYHLLFLDYSIRSIMDMIFAPITPKWFHKMGNDLEALIKRERNFKNSTDNFFKKMEKSFKFEANKMLRKIYKLYAMLENNKKTNESIVNYKLYAEINNLEEKILKRLSEIKKERRLNEKSKPKK
jgi:hypothetical protein